MERGRSKAYRPLPPEIRAAAVERGLAAYARGAWYLAHEELEPAWMGTDDPAERALLSGLIKLAAAYVHAARGNALGVRTNLRGAHERLQTAAAAADRARGALGPGGSVDLDLLLAGLEDRLERVDDLCSRSPGSALRIDPGSRAAVAPGTAGTGIDGGVGTGPQGTGATPPSHDVAGPIGRAPGIPLSIAPLPLPLRNR